MSRYHARESAPLTELLFVVLCAITLVATCGYNAEINTDRVNAILDAEVQP